MLFNNYRISQEDGGKTPGTEIAGRTSFLSFAHDQVLSGSVTGAEIPLFQAFSPISVQGSTDDDCIKVGRRIETNKAL